MPAKSGPAPGRRELRHSRVDEAYAEIRRRILDNYYAPGHQVLEQELALELGMSRTPVREALVRLQNERFVQLIPRHGMRVVEYTGGSTGSSLAMVCAVKGYPFLPLSSDAFAQEKIRTMQAFGADVEIVPSEGGKVTPALFDRFKARETPTSMPADPTAPQKASIVASCSRSSTPICR